MKAVRKWWCWLITMYNKSFQWNNSCCVIYSSSSGSAELINLAILTFGLNYTIKGSSLEPYWTKRRDIMIQTRIDHIIYTIIYNIHLQLLWGSPVKYALWWSLLISLHLHLKIPKKSKSLYFISLWLPRMFSYDVMYKIKWILHNVHTFYVMNLYV